MSQSMSQSMRMATGIWSRLWDRLWHGVFAVFLLPVMLQGQSLPAPEESAPELPRTLPVPAYVTTAHLTSGNSLRSKGSSAGPTVSASPGSRAGNSQDSSRWRPALFASAGLAATAALVAYWSTNEADEAYDRYLHSAGQTRQDKMLDRAERHDRIAGAGFLIMEAGLVLTARFVFF